MTYRVLAVDDNAVVTGLIAAVLRQAGYHVDIAPAGGEALVILQRSPLDLEMPGLSGLDVLRILRDEKVCRGLPVIMLTGESDVHYVGRARELGAAGYLLKPFRAQDLTAKVKRVVEDADTVWLDDYHTLTRSGEDGWTRPAPESKA